MDDRRPEADLRAAIRRRTIQVLALFAVQGLILFLAAGRFDWLWGWLYMALYLAGIAVTAVLMFRTSPETIAERADVSGVRGWDRVVGGLFSLTYFFGLLAVAGLDARFGWTPELPLVVHLVGAAGFLLGYALFVWAMLFFLFGYIAYAAALGALGALAPTMREGSQFTFILLLPLMVPLWLNNVFVNDSNGPIATALSLFPLSAPTTMVTRLAAGGVPAWQPFVALAGLIVTAYLFVLLAARFFRADTLLSSTSLSWGRIAAEIRGK